MDPLYLVDGSGYIFRAFYAVAPLTNSSGLPTNAVLGFTRMLMKLLNDVHASHLVVTFDRAEPTFRHELFREYKANRKECPAELVPQMPYFRKVVNALGLRFLEQPGLEADDIIAALAKRWQSESQKIVIVSGDKDLTQLVNRNVEVWDAMRDIHYDEKNVENKFGVPPHLMADYLALVGDTSDNVPGIRGIGPKTAVSLITAFGGIEDIIRVVRENPEKIEGLKGLRGAASVRAKLESEIEQLRLSYQLVHLSGEINGIEGLASIDELLWHGLNLELAQPLFQELEFSSIISALSGPKSSTTKNNDNTYAGKNYQAVTKDSLAQLVKELSAKKAFAFDTETTSLDPNEAQLVGISLSCADGEAYFVRIVEDESRGISLREAQEQLGPIFANAEIKKVGLNLKFDLSIMEVHGFVVRGISFDAMLASHIINPDKRQNGLKFLAEHYLGEKMRTFEDLTEDVDDIRAVDPVKLCAYACHDADASWQLARVLDEKLGTRSFAPDGTELPSLRRAYEDIEVPLIPVLSAMERVGIAIDTEVLNALGTEFGVELKRLEQRIYELAGTEFNLNSPKQLSEILFERLGLPTSGVKRTQTAFSTDASVLSKFADDYPIAKELLEYREVFKLKSTYVDSLLRLQHLKTGRIHTSFNQAIAATGRLSSSEPNLQNIPIRNARGRKIRGAFVAAPGFTLISADYSQIELRILAHLSQDANLVAAFAANEDIHSRTARDIFGEIVAQGDTTGDLRRVAKTINFGVIYGIGAFRLARELGITRKQAQDYIDSYFRRYPGVNDYFTRVSRDIEERGYSETMFGRRRYISDVDSTGRDAGYAERSLLNAPIQGSAAELIKLAMINLYSKLAGYEGAARIVLQVHDELVVEVEEELVREVEELVRREMEGAIKLLVPLRVDVGVGRSWGDAL